MNRPNSLYLIRVLRSLALLLLVTTVAAGESDCPNNRLPLAQKAFVERPLGNIKAKGWLLEML